jgi:DNA-binding HxlR family transcriptional regulator
MTDVLNDDATSLASPMQTASSARLKATGPTGPVEAALDVLDRWKALIVWHLFWGARPFCELMRSTEGISKKTLRWELAEMERHGLVRKQVRSGTNRKAEYSLSPLGESLKPIVAAMYEWGLQALQDPRRRALRDPARLSASSTAAPRSPDAERRALEFPAEPLTVRHVWHSQAR